MDDRTRVGDAVRWRPASFGEIRELESRVAADKW